MALDDGSERVLQQFEEAVVQVRRDVREVQVLSADDDHLRRVAVSAVAQRARVLDGVLGDVRG